VNNLDRGRPGRGLGAHIIGDPFCSGERFSHDIGGLFYVLIDILGYVARVFLDVVR